MNDWRLTVNKNDIKPCPFCGSKSISVCHSEVKYIGQNEFGNKKIKMKVFCMCNKCFSRGKPITYIGYT